VILRDPPAQAGALGLPVVSADARGTIGQLLSTGAESFSVVLEDLNEPPTLVAQQFPLFLPENLTANTTVGIILGDDPDLYQSLEFTVTGALTDYFELVPIETPLSVYRQQLIDKNLLTAVEEIPCEVRARFASTGIVRSARMKLQLDALDYESVRAYGLDLSITDDGYLNILRTSLGAGTGQFSLKDARGDIDACVLDRPVAFQFTADTNAETLATTGNLIIVEDVDDVPVVS